MSGFFNYENKFFTAFDKIINIFCLSLIWLLACIPIFTIGAASSALYYTVNKVIRHGRGYIWREFWSSFKANFKQGTVIWLLFLLFGLLMGADWYILKQFAIAGAAWGKCYAFFIAMILMEIMLWLYVYPNIARFENTNKQIVKNSAIMAIANLPRTFLMMLILAAICFLTYLLPVVMIFMPATFIWLQNLVMEKIFRKYMSEEDLAAEEERNREYFN